MYKYKQFLSNSLINSTGLKTNRQIVVFESDDWGSIRMPSINVFNTLLKNGIPVDRSNYCKFDSLESNHDLEFLFEVIGKYKDRKGNYPVITANTVVANPNFEKIELSNFMDYHYEPYTETLKRYPNHEKVLNYYKVGIDENIFYPQFHGREHVNVEMWLKLLKINKDFKLAFDNKLWGLSNDVFPYLSKSIQATYDSLDDYTLKENIVSGLKLFEDIFNIKSNSFIANNFIWNSTLNITLKENGVDFLQGMKHQILPKIDGANKRKLIRHNFGEKNSLGQYYLVRNCSFEPTIENTDYNKTLNEIKNAFLWGKPAIISTHRVNFIGSLYEDNRTKNLREFELLLLNILKKWPNVEFMNSSDLGNEIKNGHL